MRAGVPRADANQKMRLFFRPCLSSSVVYNAASLGDEAMMNIHHLELFYYVARHGGISEAVRNMPYGIQQPAVSSQIIQLEETLGTTLFQRRPFALTAVGQQLFQFIEPFFGNLETMTVKLQGGLSQHVRVGASEVVLRDHLPRIVQEARQKFPKLTITLKQGYQNELEEMLAAQELDLAVTIIEKKPLPGIKTLPMIELPLVLLVPRKSAYSSADELWKQDKIQDALISLPDKEPIPKSFQAGLARRGVDWFTGIEVSSLELVQTYVANNYGIGVTIGVPRTKYHPDVRVLPLDGFPTVVAGVLYPGKLTPLLQELVDSTRRAADQLKAGPVG